MSSYKTHQQIVKHGGREFHFVSYEARPADPRTGADAQPATWYLMSAGKRWPALEEVSGQDAESLVDRLVAWLDAHVLARPQ